ncbi:unnamed protein product [Urochloa humidicola]
MTFVGFTTGTESEGSPSDLVSKRKRNHAEEGTEEPVPATESEGSPGDLVVKTRGGNHAEEEETEETVAGSPNTRAVMIVGRPESPDESKEDGSESPNDKKGYLAEDAPKYDESDTADDKDRDKAKKGKDRDGVPFDTERANRNSLIFLSLLLMVAMPAVVHCSFSEPLILVWRLSFLLCSCCAIWACLLAVALPAQTILRHLMFAFLLALYVDAALNPKIGMLLAHLNSHLAVGILGYALAERRQADGTEVSAAVVCFPSDKRHADKLNCALVVGRAYFGMITVGFAAGVVWVLFHAADHSAEGFVVYVFLPLCSVLIMWITYVGAMLLRGALITETVFSALIMYFGLVIMFYACSALTMGDIWGMLVAWPLMLAFSGGFGYCICVHSSYKLRMKLGLRPVKPNESKEEFTLRTLLEKQKQGHGNGDLRPGNNVISCSFSTQEEVGVKSKIA